MNWWVRTTKRFVQFYIEVYIEDLLILASTVTGCVSVSVFASLVGIAIVITSFAVTIKICAITAGTKKYESIIKKKKKKYNKIVLLVKKHRSLDL